MVRPSLLRVALAGSVLGVAVTGCGRAGHQSGGPGTTGAVTAPPTADVTITAPAQTTTTVDPGLLPQTPARPSGEDPGFQARMEDLLRAVAAGQPGLATDAFFPQQAYIQVKAIADPVHDYQTRLIGNYDRDILTLHSEADPSGGPLPLDHMYVPPTAEWIQPGVEANKGSYWRVYGSRVFFRIGGQLHYFTIASLISWRGEWYVVHLNSIH
ncbi:MAG TPA: hypothetical protein VKI19_05055 [Acidimicrobiales bacterium]|nr:hypothetical protein [Acidimicrobiales bacterium]